MADQSLEERVAALERQVAALGSAAAGTNGDSDWRRLAGMFTGDDGMRQLFEEAMKLREADRERARRRYAKAGRTARKTPAAKGRRVKA